MPYSERYVAFIDILGFSAKVMSTDRDGDSSQADMLAATLKKTASREESLDDLIADDFHFQSFSDSIVASSPANPAGLAYLMYAVWELAYNLLSSGLLVRGSIAKGKLHHTEDVMFGPAFLEAYRNEREIAKYPRIVLTRAVHKDALANTRSDAPPIVLSDDGPPYIDILHWIAELNLVTKGPRRINQRQVKIALRWHKSLQQQLDESIYEPRHFEKLRWFAIYWNGKVGFTPGAPVPPLVLPNSRYLSPSAT